MNILLLGAKGQLGFELNRLLNELGLGCIHALSREELDLSDLNALEKCVQNIQPELIFNAAAYTAVDLAERQSELAYTINQSVPDRLAKYAQASGAALVHYSTDFVFDGQKNTPYVESDTTHPLSVYGQSKLAGEEAIRASGCQHLIFRTGWLMGAYGQNFLKTMLRLAKEKKELKIIADQLGAPTSAKWLAKSSISALQKCLDQKANTIAPHWGLYHASSAGITSGHAYATEAIAYAQKLGATHALNIKDILPIPSTAYPLPAKRPAYSVLNNEKLKANFGVDVPLWTSAVHEVLDELSRLGEIN